MSIPVSHRSPAIPPTPEPAVRPSADPSRDRPQRRPLDLAALRTELQGALTAPEDADWDRARQAWNLAVDQQPDAVVDVADVGDIQVAVRFAAANGLQVAMQGTGHGAATLDTRPGTLLVRTGALTGVHVDPVARRARVGAGVLARDLVAAAADHGLAFLAGSSEDVGVIGYTLGGGVGWLGRQHGLACNQVLAAEVVTADGALRRIDGAHDPELFWALRGGGGAFAAVTALEVALHPIARVHAGVLRWPLEQASEVLHAWRVWTQEVPDSVTSIGRLLRYPPLPDLPVDLRGRAFVAVEVAFLDREADAERWLRPLRALRPTSDTFATVPAPALGQLHGDPTQPVPAIGDHHLLSELTPEALDALLEVAGPGRELPLLAVDVRHLGGAMGTARPDHGVLDRLAAGFALFAVGVPVTPEIEVAIGRALSALDAATAPWDAGRAYLNFADQPVEPSRLFGSARFSRLRAVKRAYDPQDRFLSNHPVPV
jgi:hypothetical protein